MTSAESLAIQTTTRPFPVRNLLLGLAFRLRHLLVVLVPVAFFSLLAMVLIEICDTGVTSHPGACVSTLQSDVEDEIDWERAAMLLQPIRVALCHEDRHDEVAYQMLLPEMVVYACDRLGIGLHDGYADEVIADIVAQTKVSYLVGEYMELRQAMILVSIVVVFGEERVGKDLMQPLIDAIETVIENVPMVLWETDLPWQRFLGCMSKSCTEEWRSVLHDVVVDRVGNPQRSHEYFEALRIVEEPVSTISNL